MRRASRRLNSNRSTSGSIEISIVTGSVPGRSIATTAITRIAYLRLRASRSGVVIPSRVTARTPIGIWNSTPTAR